MTTRTTYVERLSFTLLFPSGIAAGAGASGNRLLAARDGQGRLVLRGSALAGVLRSAWRNHCNADTDDKHEDITRIFGSSADTGLASALVVHDIVLDIGAAKETHRTYHRRNRHTGAVADHGLYSVEAAPPGTMARVTLWLNHKAKENENENEKKFFPALATLLDRGLIFGGNGNRGLGLAKIDGDLEYGKYDLTDEKDLADYLDDHRSYRTHGTVKRNGSLPLTENVAAAKMLRIDFALKIPRGQDLLVSAGQGMDVESEPHKIKKADGREYWMIPGSTLHGLLRSWYTRLVAREGKSVSDSVARYEEKGEATGDDFGWMFAKNQKDDDHFLDEIANKYPVEFLFGSLHKSGRLHVTDGFSEVPIDGSGGDIQYRKHVALDAISGGAIEHLLFDNNVLTKGTFHFTILVHDPSEEEARRLAQTFRAIDSGLLRIGSSKSAGRLELVGGPKADGPCAEEFDNAFKYRPEMKKRLVLAETEVSDGNNGTNENNRSNVPTVRTGKYFLDQTFDRVARKPVLFHAVQLEDGNREHIAIPDTLYNKMERQPSIDDQLDVSIDGTGTIIAVSHASRPVSVPQDAPPRQTGHSSHGQGRQQPTNTNQMRKGPPSILGLPFHNPYTFIDFGGGNERKTQTPLTIDEKESQQDRFTGVIELGIRTESPLMSCLPSPRSENDHSVYSALTIDNDVIVPATGVRGFLRYLLTIATGGPLTTVDKEMFLCQGRDLNLGPSLSNGPQHVALGMVEQPGNSRREGTIQLGVTALVPAQDIEDLYGGTLPRPEDKKNVEYLWADYDDREGILRSVSENQDNRHTWKIKLAGKPVTMGKRWNKDGTPKESIKKEGVFLPSGPIITIPESFWLAYANRNRHGARPELSKGDLVWLELSVDTERPTHANQIRSIQWARWGRAGKKLTEVLPRSILPDQWQKDGLVSTVSDLFGLISEEKGAANVPTFAGRIRPDNLVFENGKEHLTDKVPIAVLSSPHPGCLTFYRKNVDSNALSQADPLSGYKVYRTSKHSASDDPAAPWRFENQGVYDDAGRVKDGCQKVNYSAELLKENVEGHLRLSVRGLSQKELALLLKACSVPWRLGGGKSLGLGVCRVETIVLRDEFGDIVPLPDDLEKELSPAIQKNFAAWKASQEPVETMRYPLATCHLMTKNSRGGLVWFQKFSVPKKSANDESGHRGMEPLYVIGELMKKVRQANVNNSQYGDADLIEGQMLPKFDPKNPQEDVLYGYDAFLCDTLKPEEYEKLGPLERQQVEFNRNRNIQAYPAIEAFDEEKHITGSEQTSGTTGQNRDTREKYKKGRNKK